MAALLIAVAPSARAQSTRPQFEVASVKLATTVPRVGEPMEQLSLDAAKGRFLAKGMTVKVLLRYAFDLQLPKDEMLRSVALLSGTRLQVVGGPSWVGTDRF